MFQVEGLLMPSLAFELVVLMLLIHICLFSFTSFLGGFFRFFTKIFSFKKKKKKEKFTNFINSEDNAENISQKTEYEPSDETDDNQEVNQISEPEIDADEVEVQDNVIDDKVDNIADEIAESEIMPEQEASETQENEKLQEIDEPETENIVEDVIEAPNISENFENAQETQDVNSDEVEIQPEPEKQEEPVDSFFDWVVKQKYKELDIKPKNEKQFPEIEKQKEEE